MIVMMMMMMETETWLCHGLHLHKHTNVFRGSVTSETTSDKPPLPSTSGMPP